MASGDPEVALTHLTWWRKMARRRLTDGQIISIFLDKRKIREIALEHGLNEAYVSAIQVGRNHARITRTLARKTSPIEDEVAKLIVRNYQPGDPEATLLLVKQIINLILEDVRGRI